MTWVNQAFVFDPTNKIQMVTSAQGAKVTQHDGFVYNWSTQSIHTNSGAVNDSTDVWHNGRRFDSIGNMRIFASNGVLPAGTTFNAGFAITPTGQQCVHATGTLAVRLGGWPVTALGEIIVVVGAPQN